MKTIPYLIVLLTLGSLTLAGEKPAAGPAGDWHGAIALPWTKLEIAVDLKEDAKTAAWSGTIDIPAHMLHGFTLSDVRVEGKQVSFKMPDIPGDPGFSGTLSADGEKMAGDFRQNGQPFPFTLELGAAKEPAGETPSYGVPGLDWLVIGKVLCGPAVRRSSCAWCCMSFRTRPAPSAPPSIASIKERKVFRSRL